MLRKLRILLAILFLVGITLVFLDFTGMMYGWLGWMTRIQFMPAVLAMNIGLVIALVVATLLLGRVYCSVVCPLGVLQDVVSRIATKRKKNRFRYSCELKWIRYGVLVAFVAALVGGVVSFAALIEPYSAYGRIASNLFAPVWKWGNNLLAYFAERADNYAFYQVQVWLPSALTLTLAMATLVVVVTLAWRGGRIYCNSICPVGSVLGLISKVSILKPRINTNKCNGCGLCARNCKSSCIDAKHHKIDYSRCVVCFDCIGKCKQDAIKYQIGGRHAKVAASSSEPIADSSRRAFLATGVMLVASVARAQKQKMDGGLALIVDKQVPERATPIVPPGAGSLRHFRQHCTGCQLCVSACKNQVLRPSSSLDSFMQPEVSFERGYCRAECNDCSTVCPTGAIRKITTADKSATQIGHAVWIEKNCIPLRDDVDCDNCARHCPAKAIVMVEKEGGGKRKIPIIDTERCIGCGACENLCPARPFSAIYVEGHQMHRVI